MDCVLLFGSVANRCTVGKTSSSFRHREKRSVLLVWTVMRSSDIVGCSFGAFREAVAVQFSCI